MGLCWTRSSKWSPPLRWAPLNGVIYLEFLQNNFYHLFNRSNNKEIVFKSRENFFYFLSKYHKYLSEFVETLAYCLMPDHFHFLIYVKTKNIEQLKKNIGILLSSYTKAINKAYNRNGSLFQQHTKTKLLLDEKNIHTVLAYIHQNPVRKGLVKRIEDWDFSSYPGYIGMTNNALVEKSFVLSKFNTIDEFKFFSRTKIDKIDFILS